MSDRARLILLSFLMLFVELALIRWTGSNVVYLSYFSNFVLLGSFLGIGIGFLRAEARWNSFRWAPIALALLVAFVLVFSVKIDRSGSQIIYFGEFEKTGLPAWLTLPVIFLAAATVMAMIAEGVARTFIKFPPLEAYRLDILGSVAGIVAFSVLAFFHAPPVVWGIVATVVFLVLAERHRRVSLALTVLALVAMVGLLAWESLDPRDSWSPYYKITLEGDGPDYGVAVNGIPHQAITPVEQRRQLEPIYFLPYERVTDSNPLEDVLIVGAGTGTDVAIALSEGVGHIDAVEIDPRLYEMGVELHPDRPYQDPRVDAYVDDGRAFLERTDNRYDLILFALPDSLTLVSGQSSLRLESYLFTLQAIEEAREHLKPGGTFGMYNFYRETWLIDRLGRTLTEAYGTAPCIDQVGGGGLALFTAGVGPGTMTCEATWQPIAGAPPAPALDDYPFLYLKERGVPSFYLLALALILVVSVALVRIASGPLRSMRPYVDLGFMGAAFLLLETKNVVGFALFFGTTWFVNALVFTGILLSVYAAVEVARRVTWRRPLWLYGALLISLAVAWVVPPSAILGLPVALRFVAATALAFAPIFLANLVFAERFKSVGASAVAFGANLLGAMIGGVLEYAALAVGYRSLLILAAALYGFAFLFGRDHLTTAGYSASSSS